MTHGRNQEELVGAAIVPFDTITLGSAAPSVSPQWGVPGYGIRNVSYNGQQCGSPFRSTSGQGPGSLSLQINEGVSATWSASVGVPAQVVSAGVGFDVTSSYHVTSGFTVYVPSGKTYQLMAYPMYNVYMYQVYYNPTIGGEYWVGSGYAQYPVEICYAWSEV